jgi:hypothetical protein
MGAMEVTMTEELEYKKDEVTTHWKLVSREKHAGYWISLNTCAIDVGVIVLTLIEDAEGKLINSHQTIFSKKPPQQ